MTTLNGYASNIKLSGIVQEIHHLSPGGTSVFLLNSKPGSTANQILMCVTGDWCISSSFIAPQDMVEACHFDVRPPPEELDLSKFQPGILCIFPNVSTEVTVIRAKRVIINYRNVGSLNALDLTDREQKSAQFVYNQSFPKLLPPSHHKQPDVTVPSVAAIAAPPLLNSERNLFSNIDKYYDVIYGQREHFDKKIQFVERMLSFRERVLDLGCGTGLYSYALRADGIKCVCVDASTAMQKANKEKNQFVADVEGPNSILKGTPIPFHLADITSFSLATVDVDGKEKYVDFAGVLALDVFSFLPSIQHVERALRNMALHHSREGVAVVSIPNAELVLAAGSMQTAYRRDIDKFKLSIGASTGLPHGSLDIVERVLIQQLEGCDELHPSNRSTELADGVPRRVTTIIGNAFHPRAHTEDGKFVAFTETFTELILSNGAFESLVKKAGYSVEALYGSLDGSVYNKATSPSVVYILKRL